MKYSTRKFPERTFQSYLILYKKLETHFCAPKIYGEIIKILIYLTFATFYAAEVPPQSCESKRRFKLFNGRREGKGALGWIVKLHQ